LENFIRNSDSNRRGIIPDILVQNYPVSQDDITQIHTASARTKPAIIEIKGLRISPNTYPATIRATDSRARRIPKEYQKKAHRIDSVVAPSKTRPLEMANGPTRPFEKALCTFATGVLFPFVLEPLEKPTHRLTNLSSNLQTLLQKLHTADDYRPIPSSLDVVLILFFVSVVFSEFSLLKRMQGTKLERLHLVGSTRDEAVHLANSQKQQNCHHWNPYTDCPSRYSNNYSRGSNYQSWYEFRQSSRYFSV
jgi:hypothetical protein